MFRFSPVVFYPSFTFCTEIQSSRRITCVRFLVSDSNNEKKKQKTNVVLQPLSWKGQRVLVEGSYNISNIYAYSNIKHVMISVRFETILGHTTKQCLVHDNS